MVKIADRIIENAYDSKTLLTGLTLLGSGEGFRLRALDLPEAEAQQSRLRVARSLALLNLNRKSVDWETDSFFHIVWMVMVPLILFFTLLPLLLVIVIYFFQAHLKRPKPQVLKLSKVYVFIDLGLSLILALLVVFELLKNRSERELLWFLFYIAALFASWGAMGLPGLLPVKLTHLRRPRLWIAALCGSVWFKGTVFWTVGSLSMAMPDHFTDWLPYLGILLLWSFLCVLVCTELIYRPEAFTEKCWNGPALLPYWVVILMIFHIFGLASIPMERAVSDPFAQNRPFPQATQETYKRFILGRETDPTASKSDPHPGIPGGSNTVRRKILRLSSPSRKLQVDPFPITSLSTFSKTATAI